MEELSNQWLNWDEWMLPQVVEAGALTPELEQTTKEITDSLEQYGQEIGDEIRRVGHRGPYRRQFSDKALREDKRWKHIRELANKALSDLHDLGVLTRELTDPDYNSPLIERSQ